MAGRRPGSAATGASPESTVLRDPSELQAPNELRATMASRFAMRAGAADQLARSNMSARRNRAAGHTRIHAMAGSIARSRKRHKLSPAADSAQPARGSTQPEPPTADTYATRQQRPLMNRHYRRSSVRGKAELRGGRRPATRAQARPEAKQKRDNDDVDAALNGDLRHGHAANVEVDIDRIGDA